MELSVKKLKEHIGAGGKYAKHIHMYDVDSDEDADYVAVGRHYILNLPKETITLNPEINHINFIDWLTTVAEEATQELTYYATVDTGHPKKSCMFVNEEGEKIYVNKSYFTDFINGAYLERGGFAEGISFTGSKFSAPVFMWYGEEFVGMFLPLIFV